MSLLELVILSIGLAMDAFAVSICKGLAMKSINMAIKRLYVEYGLGHFRL